MKTEAETAESAPPAEAPMTPSTIVASLDKSILQVNISIYRHTPHEMKHWLFFYLDTGLADRLGDDAQTTSGDRWRR